MMDDIKTIFGILLVILYYIVFGMFIAKIARFFGDRFKYCERIICFFQKIFQMIKCRK